ncbi:hypothetical protein IRP70_004820 [Salmonella enterica]|nr:hypothetical protein [Salmonella enterica]EGM2983567.1 hypothetical protein [Salmonella enterica]
MMAYRTGRCSCTGCTREGGGIPGLTRREVQILRWIMSGAPVTEFARRHSLARKTVYLHRVMPLTKLGAILAPGRLRHQRRMWVLKALGARATRSGRRCQQGVGMIRPEVVHYSPSSPAWYLLPEKWLGMLLTEHPELVTILLTGLLMWLLWRGRT